MPCQDCLTSPKTDCKQYPDTHCIIWSGANMPCLDVRTNERLDSILWKINEKICSLETPQTCVVQGEGIIVTGNGMCGITPYTISIGQVDWLHIINAPSFLTSYTETDPLFTASAAYNITTTLISQWNQAYTWGNHATQGYLKSFTETDPTVASYIKAIPAGSDTNYFLHWNGSTYVPGPISYDQITGTPPIPASYTDEQAQDAVGHNLLDSSSIDFTYDDPSNTFTAVVKDSYLFEKLKIKRVRFRVGDVDAPVEGQTSFFLKDCSGNPLTGYDAELWREGNFQTPNDGEYGYTYNPATAQVTVVPELRFRERLYFKLAPPDIYEDCDYIPGSPVSSTTTTTTTIPGTTTTTTSTSSTTTTTTTWDGSSTTTTTTTLSEYASDYGGEYA